MVGQPRGESMQLLGDRGRCDGLALRRIGIAEQMQLATVTGLADAFRDGLVRSSVADECLLAFSIRGFVVHRLPA